MDFEKITKVFDSSQNQTSVLARGKKEDHFYRRNAVLMVLLKPFPYEKALIENYRDPVSKFIYQKKIIDLAQAFELKVQPEDIHFIPQVMYHLDTFLKPGPKHSMFVADFAMNCELLKGLLAEADERKLTPKDRQILHRYLASSEKLDLELSPLLNEARKKIEKASLKPIPMPGVFFDEPLKSEKTYNFNVMNAISGWSEKTGRYYYITSGIMVGDQLGDIFMDLIVKFLKSYQPDIDVFFVGSPPENPKDFSEAMDTWNDVRLQAGIHCFSFETETAAHME
jgi:hypothetical protein